MDFMDKFYGSFSGFLIFHTVSARKIFIQVLETPNPLTLKFVPGMPILGQGRGTLQFDSIKEAKISPLAMLV